MNKKPNIVFVLTDDQGAWAMHCAGNDELVTPNLDRIANNGMLFKNFFCASPVCSPARASLLTGNIPSGHGVLDWIKSGNVDIDKFTEEQKQSPTFKRFQFEDKPIQYLAGQTCYTDILTQYGYTCALSGKWHLGDSVNPQHGFKYWYTIARGGCEYYFPDMVEDGKVVFEEDKYVSTIITDKAIDFIDALDKKPEPFYLSVHYTAPHSPWGENQHPKDIIDYYDKCPLISTPDVPDHPDRAFKETYGTPERKEKLRGYFSAITAMDREVGRILDKLEADGILDETIFIFTGDNGMSMGHHGIWGKGNGTRPMNMYDTAVKVPFIISYPEMIEKNTICNNMVSAYDFFPTILEMVGCKANSTARLPGKSFVPCLKQEQVEDDNEVVVFDEYGPVRMIRTPKYKYIARYPYGPYEFYDLEKDPEEENNVVNEDEYQELVLSMRAKLEKWFNTYVNPDIDGSREGVTGSGQYCSAGIYAEKVEKYSKPGFN